MSKEAMKLALEAWQTSSYGQPSHHKAMVLAMTALRQALAEQPAQQEPIAGVVIREGLPTLLRSSDIKVTDVRLYTRPQAREWVGLTDEEQTQVAWSCGAMSADWLEFARAIEAKLKERNT